MTAATHRRGRPSKGERRVMVTRVPTQLSDEVIAQAEARGLSWGEYIADILAEAHGYPRSSLATRRHQEELPLDQAS